MEPTNLSYTATITAASTTPAPAMSPFGVDVFALIGRMLSNQFGGSVADGGLVVGLLAFLSVLWTVFTITAYLVALLFIVLYVYASIRASLYSDLADQQLRDMELLYDEQVRGVHTHSRLDDVLTHASSHNPNDWKLAIIEADIILDDALKERGYAGNSLGERLKSISSTQLPSLNDAWEAHKVRNRIAHEGSDFVLTQRIAQETITRYQRVFTDLGVK